MVKHSLHKRVLLLLTSWCDRCWLKLLLLLGHRMAAALSPPADRAGLGTGGCAMGCRPSCCQVVCAVHAVAWAAAAVVLKGCGVVHATESSSPANVRFNWGLPCGGIKPLPAWYGRTQPGWLDRTAVTWGEGSELEGLNKRVNTPNKGKTRQLIEIAGRAGFSWFRLIWAVVDAMRPTESSSAQTRSH